MYSVGYCALKFWIEFFQDLLRFGRIGRQALDRRAVTVLDLIGGKSGILRDCRCWSGSGFWRG